MKNHNVHIVILNWNGWEDTIACINSVRNIEYRNYQIVVVDNGSTDESVERIRRECHDVTLIETKKNLGFSGGCNVGIRRAIEENADYIWLLNNDTNVHPAALRTMVDVAENQPKVGAVGSVLYYMDDAQTVQAWGGGYINWRLGTSKHYLRAVPQEKVDYITGASILLRRAALEQVGLLDEASFFMYWEDADIGLRLRKAGWNLAVAAESIVFHKESASLGKGNPVLTSYYNCSAVRFFKLHSRLAIFPCVVGVMGRLFKRVIRKDVRGFLAILNGVRNA